MSYATPHSLNGITDVFAAASNVVQDPCLGQVAALTLRLHQLEQPGALGATAAPTEKGIGLCRVVGPLKAYAWTREHPWMTRLGIVAALGGLVGLGYALGRQRRGR